MKLEILAEGFVLRCPETGPRAAAVAPRAALAAGGELLCSLALQSGIGQNDGVTVLCRSKDLGLTWQEQGPVWPGAVGAHSIFADISRTPSGEHLLLGMRWKIDAPGESFVHPENHGLKDNEMIWARSADQGRTWSEPAVIPRPVPGAAEVPGVLLATRQGRWLAPYVPYPTWDPGLRVDVSKVIVVGSDDQGRTWPHWAAMLQVAEPDSSGNEQWVVELSDGRLLGTAWHIDLKGKTPYPNIYALSHDGGLSWGPTRSTGLVGQSMGTAALADGRVACVYNVRTTGEPGVWLAVARPDDRAFNAEFNQPVWRAQAATQRGSSGELAEGGWLDFAFGEPAVLPLPDGTLLVLLWCLQPEGRGIRYVKVHLT
ncbi:MAG: exo-alpha-sialidase [Armatimonadetes bacterium]|nr:exo-alpha-sialidase [Armatimonadota bacterium]